MPDGRTNRMEDSKEVQANSPLFLKVQGRRGASFAPIMRVEAELNRQDPKPACTYSCRRKVAPHSRTHKAVGKSLVSTSLSPSLTIFCFVLLGSFLNLNGFMSGVGAESLANSFFTEPDTQPGIVSRVGPRAFSMLSDYVRQRVDKMMKSGTLHYNTTVSLTPLVSFSMASARMLNYDPASFQSRLGVAQPPTPIVTPPAVPPSPSPAKGIVWTGSGLRATVGSVYKILSPNGELTGQVPVTFDKALVELLFQPSVNSDGHLRTEVEKCRVLVNALHLDFTPGDLVVIRNYVPLIHRAVRDQLDALLCPSFQALLTPVLANRLFNTPMSAALFDHYFINFGLMGPINYMASPMDTVEMHHRGNVFGIIRQGRNRLNDFRLPFRSAPLQMAPPPTFAQQQHMVTFHMSNYTLASTFFWMDQYRKFDYEISQKSVNDSNIAGYLRTECGPKDICAGTLFPALAKSFPSGVVSIRTHTSQHPTVRLEKGKAFVIINSKIDAFVTQPDKTRRFLNAVMLAELSLQKTQFRDYTFKAQLAIENFKITDVVSLVEGLDAGSIEFLVGALNELIIADDMAKKLKEGIRLPILFDFEQQSAELHFEKDQLWVGVNFCYDETCPATERLNAVFPTPVSGGGDTGANGTVPIVNGGNIKKAEKNQEQDMNYYDATG